MPTDILAALDADCGPECRPRILGTRRRVPGRDSRPEQPRIDAALPHRPGGTLRRAAPASHGRPIAEIVARLRDEVLPDCNHLYHPRYIGHQVSAPLPAAIWMESLTAALNQSLAVWEMSPVATVIEHQVIRWLTTLAGYGPDAGGTLTTGGTEATFTALLAARAALLPDSWTNGVTDAPLLVCGEHAHYAVTRAAGALGLGLAQCAARSQFGTPDGPSGTARHARGRGPPGHGGRRDRRIDRHRLVR